MQHKNISDLLKEYRRDKLGKSVREAAELMGVHYTYLSRLENGISEPSDEVLERIAKTYALSAEEKAEMYVSVKLTPSFEAAMKQTIKELGEKKAAEIMFRKSKDKK